MAELTVEAKTKLAEAGITVETDAKTGKQTAVHPSGVKSEMPSRDEQLAELDAQIADLQAERENIEAMYETEK